MKKYFVDAFKRLNESTISWLILIGILSTFVRSIPAWINAAWGCDFGIYYGLTKAYVEIGEIPANYNIWGGAYQYFPTIYIFGGIVHQLTKIDILWLLPKFVPIFGGLSVVIFYFITKELFKDRKICILSSLLLAVLPFHAYQTSQAAPLTFGHFFLMLSLYLFIKARKDKKYIPILIVSTLLLIVTHHLTTYIYLITLVFVMVVENLSRDTWLPSFKFDISYILFTSFSTFTYWIMFAKPVFESFMKVGLKLGPICLDQYLVIAAFYLLLFLLLAIILLSRRYNISFRRSNKIPKTLLFFSVLFSSVIVFAILSILNLPWGKIYFSLESTLFLMPFFIVLSFAGIGFYKVLSFPNGRFVCGWFTAIFISMLYGFFSLNTIILPHRHLEYLMAPISIMASYGIIGTFRTFRVDYSIIINFRSLHLRRTKLILPLIVVIIIASNGLSVYPSYLSLEKLEISYETITDEDIYAMKWINENLDRNTTVIASDHRLSLLVNAYGFNTTMDKTLLIWNSTNLSDYINELENEYYGRVTHIIIDDIMKNEVVIIGFNNTKVYMTNENSTAGYDKFSKQPFELLYRNETSDKNLNKGEAIHWVEIYKVNWSYIEENYHDLL